MKWSSPCPYLCSLLPLLLTTMVRATVQLPDSPAASPDLAPLHNLQRHLVDLARDVLPSVVTVRGFERIGRVAGAMPAAAAGASGWMVAKPGETDYPGFQCLGTASGFFAGEAGDVLTCLHPLQGKDGKLADLVEIEAEGVRILSDIVGIEPTLDLAVLHPAVFSSWQRPAMKPIPFGDSDALACGSLLFGCGDPPGPRRILAMGLLVGKPSRDCYQDLMEATYLQASMVLSPLAYGGPLVDLDGRVVGILSRTSADAAADPLGSQLGSVSALPSKILNGLHDAIRTAGTRRSPWLGFAVTSQAELVASRGFAAVQAMDRPRQGIAIENVFQPSPAATAGIEPGDFLTRFDGVEIFAPVDFQRQLYLAGVGATVQLQFYRKGKTLTMALTVDGRPIEATPR